MFLILPVLPDCDNKMWAEGVWNCQQLWNKRPRTGASSTLWTTKGVRPQEQQTLWAQSFPRLAWHEGLWILQVRRAAWVLLFLMAAVVFIYLLIYFASQTQPYWQVSACPRALFHPPTAVHTEIISCRGVGNRCRTGIFPLLLSSLAVFLPPYKLQTACCLPTCWAFLSCHEQRQRVGADLVLEWTSLHLHSSTFHLIYSSLMGMEEESAAWVDSSPPS